ncbi:MAG: response regulator transcription factor [Pseudomonadota bacterium]
MPMLRALIVEDDPDFSELLHRIVLDDTEFETISIASSLADAREYLTATEFGLILLDLGLPDGSGVDLLGTIPATTSVIVVTVFDDEPDVIDAMARGANGYLLKDDPALGQAIVATINGGSSLSPSVAAHLVSSWRRLTGAVGDSRGDTEPTRLSPREREILQSFADGLTYQDTARRLGISQHTVADHVKNLYRKLQVNSRAAAVNRGLQEGLVRVQSEPT